MPGGARGAAGPCRPPAHARGPAAVRVRAGCGTGALWRPGASRDRRTAAIQHTPAPTRRRRSRRRRRSCRRRIVVAPATCLPPCSKAELLQHLQTTRQRLQRLHVCAQWAHKAKAVNTCREVLKASQDHSGALVHAGGACEAGSCASSSHACDTMQMGPRFASQHPPLLMHPPASSACSRRVLPPARGAALCARPAV